MFEASAAHPPVERVVGKLKVQVCRINTDSDAQAAAMTRLREKATALGATAVVNVSFKMETSRFAYIKNGFPNPCRFETDAKGAAVVLSSTAAG